MINLHRDCGIYATDTPEYRPKTTISRQSYESRTRSGTLPTARGSASSELIPVVDTRTKGVKEAQPRHSGTAGFQSALRPACWNHLRSKDTCWRSEPYLKINGDTVLLTD